jgi:hypothetical protein
MVYGLSSLWGERAHPINLNTQIIAEKGVQVQIIRAMAAGYFWRDRAQKVCKKYAVGFQASMVHF